MPSRGTDLSLGFLAGAGSVLLQRLHAVKCDTSEHGGRKRTIMSAKTPRSGDNARTAAQQSSSKDAKQKVPKQLIERIKEATGATDEVIVHTLEECNGDPNEATTRLIESALIPSLWQRLSMVDSVWLTSALQPADPFTEFTTKAKRKQQV